jgi:hypothetical protein
MLFNNCFIKSLAMNKNGKREHNLRVNAVYVVVFVFSWLAHITAHFASIQVAFFYSKQKKKISIPRVSKRERKKRGDQFFESDLNCATRY